MNFKQYDDGKEGRFFVILDNGMEAGWIQYKWLGNGNLLANGTRVYEEFKDQKLGIPLFNKLVEFAEKKGKQKFIHYVRLWSINVFGFMRSCPLLTYLTDRLRSVCVYLCHTSYSYFGKFIDNNLRRDI